MGFEHILYEVSDAICTVTLNRPDALSGTMLAELLQALENRAALQGLIEQVTSQEPRQHWLVRCEAAGVPAGPIYSVPEALADPHAQARGMVQEITHPVAGRVRGLGNPVKLSASPATMRKAAPVLGEDTEAILAELGYGTGEIARLREKGVLGP